MKIKRIYNHHMLHTPHRSIDNPIKIKYGPMAEDYMEFERKTIETMRWLVRNMHKMAKYHNETSEVSKTTKLDENVQNILNTLVGEFEEYVKLNFRKQMNSEREKMRQIITLSINALYDERARIWRKDAIYEFIVPFFGKTGKVPYPYNTLFPIPEIKHHIISFIDIDYLKKVNDQKGHIYADMVLRQICGIINETAMKYGGMAFRYGGDEVVVWFPVSLDMAKKAIIEMRKKIAEIQIERYQISNNRTREWMTISVGLTEINGTFEKTLDFADELCYISKNGDKDTSPRDNITINPVKISKLTDYDMEQWRPISFREFIDFKSIDKKWKIEMRKGVAVLIDKKTGEIVDELTPSKTNHNGNSD